MSGIELTEHLVDFIITMFDEDGKETRGMGLRYVHCVHQLDNSSNKLVTLMNSIPMVFRPCCSKGLNLQFGGEHVEHFYKATLTFSWCLRGK